MILFINKETAIESHDESLQIFGGDNGVRDMNMLESAIESPINRYLYEKCTLSQLAATYLYHINKNHPFVDGNKRTSWLVTEIFVEINGCRIDMSQEQIFNLIISIANGTLSRIDVEKVLENHIKSI